MITDKQRLDWLQKQGDGSTWVARRSTTGRGYRLHNTTGMDYAGHQTIRAAIDAAMQEQQKKENRDSLDRALGIGGSTK